MHSLTVETNTKKDIPLTFQFKKSYYALFCIYLKVTVSCGPHHRNLAHKKITQPGATVGWQPKHFVRTPTGSSLHRQTAYPLALVWLQLSNQTCSYRVFFFFKDSPSFISQRHNFLMKMIDFSLIPCSANQLENDRRHKSIQAERGYENLDEAKRGRQKERPAR